MAVLLQRPQDEGVGFYLTVPSRVWAKRLRESAAVCLLFYDGGEYSESKSSAAHNREKRPLNE